MPNSDDHLCYIGFPLYCLHTYLLDIMRQIVCFTTPQVLNPGNTPTTRTTGPKISTAAQYPPLPLYKLRAEALIEPEVI